MDVCRTVTFALQRHLASTSSDLLGSLSLSLSLSTESEREPSSLSHNAAVLSTQSAAGIAQWSTTAMFYLCRGSEGEHFRAQLRECGACEAVARALLRFSGECVVAQAALRALVVLITERDAPAPLWQSRLGAMNVCACVVDTLRMFPASLEVCVCCVCACFSLFSLSLSLSLFLSFFLLFLSFSLLLF